MSKLKAWKEISRKSVFFMYGRGVDKVVYELPDGSQADYYIKNEKSGVAIVALTEDNMVLLVKQYRPGPNKMVDELPSGFIDDNETPEQAIGRELKEETGYTGNIEWACEFHDDAYANRLKVGFVAKNCIKVTEPMQTPTEQTEVVLISVDEFRDRLKKGQFSDVALGYMAMDYLGLI